MKMKFLLFGLAALFSYGTAWSQTSFGGFRDSDPSNNAGTDGGNTNSYFGFETGLINTGHDNTFVGHQSGLNNTANFNTFLGSESGRSTTSGGYNTFVGYQSGRNNETGGSNTFIGRSAGENHISGSSNTFLGHTSGRNNIFGSGNVFVGRYAGHENGGSYNIFLGYSAGYNETGSNLLYIDNSNTASPLIWGDFSANALRFHGTVRITNIPQDNTLTQVLVADNDGNVNWRDVASLADNHNFPSYPESAGDGGGNTNSFFGHLTGSINTGVDNTLIGFQSGLNNTTGYENSSLGSRTLENNTTGARNTANGVFTLFGNVQGNENTAVGYAALGFNVNGDGNTAIGFRTLLNNNNGNYNTATGYEALHNNTGNRNTAMGYWALRGNIGGEDNTAIGHNALLNNNAGSNVAVGTDALRENTNGTANVALGRDALRYNAGGVNNTAIGYGSGPDSMSTGLDNTVAVGYGAEVNGSNAIAIGANVSSGANEIRIGNLEVNGAGAPVNWTVVSDGRFKINIEEDVAGLDFIKALRPVSYNLDRRKIRAFTGNTKATNSDVSKKTVGFIAQEVAQLVEENGYVFTGVKVPQNEKDHYGLKYAEFVIPLVKGMQEQQQIIESLLQRIETLENIIANTAATPTLPISNAQTKSTASDGFMLYQNIPNPFDKNTTIRALVPEAVQQAKIVVYNLQGLELESYDIKTRGNVAVEISAGRFPSGMYLYALIADDRIIDTKKMILKK